MNKTLSTQPRIKALSCTRINEQNGLHAHFPRSSRRQLSKPQKYSWIYVWVPNTEAKQVHSRWKQKRILSYTFYILHLPWQVDRILLFSTDFSMIIKRMEISIMALILSLVQINYWVFRVKANYRGRRWLNDKACHRLHSSLHWGRCLLTLTLEHSNVLLIIWVDRSMSRIVRGTCTKNR